MDTHKAAWRAFEEEQKTKQGGGSSLKLSIHMETFL